MMVMVMVMVEVETPMRVVLGARLGGHGTSQGR
jgi:hypothetical protein